jgi:hypothetical protein
LCGARPFVTFVRQPPAERFMPAFRTVPLLAALLVAACQPTVRVEAPKEPITINLNVKVDAEVRVKLEKQAEEDIKKNPDIF